MSRVVNSHRLVVGLVVVECCCVMCLFVALAVRGVDFAIGTLGRPV